MNMLDSLNKVVDYIEENLEGEINLEELAKITFSS